MMRYLYMVIALCIIGIIAILIHKFSGKRQIMLGEAKRGRVWPENIVRAFEYWLYCDTENKSTSHLLDSISEIMDIPRVHALDWMMSQSQNYIDYVDSIHPNLDPSIIDQSRVPERNKRIHN